MAISVGTISVGTISASEVTTPDVTGSLGPELQSNHDMRQGTSGWTTNGATVAAVIEDGEDAVLITAIFENFSRGILNISGLTIGNNYRVTIRAKIGAQGTTQFTGFYTWCTFSSIPITASSFTTFSFDVVATAVGGESRLNSSELGAIGDELFVSTVSIREIL